MRYATLYAMLCFQDFSHSGVQFLLQLVTLHSVAPAETSQLGGATIRLSGQNFMPPHEGQLWCVFGRAAPA